jgi:CheY-like chemotaxis protein/tetratricopeptide (TPR) repeat protein
MDPKRILVVDPSSESRQAIEEIFDLRGDQVIFAKDEQEAFLIFRDIEFDLVLAEVLLPRGSGYSLSTRIRDHEREKPAHTPVLLMGGVLRNFNLAHEARIKYGADNVLVKPFEANDLRVKLAVHLDGIDPEKLAAGDFSGLPEFEARMAKGPHITAAYASGCLSKIPFARVMGGFWQLGETGYLHCRSGSVTKTLHFQDGKLIFISGGDRRETLGWLLVREHVITPEVLIDAIARMRSTGKKLGEVLLESNAINPHDLFAMMQQEMEEKTLNLFRWTGGRYWFEPALTTVNADVVPLTIDVNSLLRKGIRNVYDAPLPLQEEFRPWTDATVLRTKDADRRVAKLQFSRHEQRLWGAIEGNVTVGKLVTNDDLDQTAAYRCLFLLLCVGAVELDHPEGAGPQPRCLMRSDDSAYRLEVDQIFREVFSTQPEAVFTVESGQGYSGQHKEMCAGLYNLKSLSRIDVVTMLKADAVFDRLEACYRVAAGEPFSEKVGGGYEPATPRAKVLEAELVFQQGMAAHRQENFLHASDFFQAAIDLDDLTADYHAYLGYSIYQQQAGQAGSEPTQAIRHLNRALELNIHLPEAYLFLGNVYMDLGQEKRAESYFEETVAYDPSNRAALRQLRLLFANRRAALLDADEENTEALASLTDYQRDIKSLFNKMQTGSFFNVLNVEPGVAPADLKRAYFSLSADLRSDKLYRLATPMTREQADEVFHFVTAAYTVLSDPEKRRAYKRELDNERGRNGGNAGDDDRDLSRAQEAFQRGRKHLAIQEFKNSVNRFLMAHDAAPNEPKYLAWTGFAKYQQAVYGGDQPSVAMARAKELLRRALAMQPGQVDASVLLGKVYLRENKPHLAEEQFDNALLADPGNIEALKSYRRIHSDRRDAAPVPLSRVLHVEQDRLYREMSDTMESLKRRDFFAVLEVPHSADAEQIKTAYGRTRAGILHNVDLSAAIPAIRWRVAEMQRLLDRAFRVLSDPHLRACYETAIQPKPAIVPVAPPENELGEGSTAEGAPIEADVESAAKKGDKTAGGESKKSAFWQKIRGWFGKSEE